jgi:hypothetical protein
MSYRRVDGRGRYGKEYGNSLVQRERERDEPMREGCKPEEHIRRCQGLAEG